MKNVIKLIDNRTAQVTKAFAKQAVIYGTEEYKLWRKFLKDFPEAKMVVKSIKKKENKKTTKNLTYKNMEDFILLQKSPRQLEAYRTVREAAKITASPYMTVVAWFKSTYNVEDFEPFIEELLNADKSAYIEESAGGARADRNINVA